MSEEHKSLEKWVPTLNSQGELYEALEKAFDYRGDITITTKDNRQIVGYIFNREAKAAEPFVELYPADKDEKIKVFYKDVAALNFSGVVGSPFFGQATSAAAPRRVELGARLTF